MMRSTQRKLNVPMTLSLSMWGVVSAVALILYCCNIKTILPTGAGVFQTLLFVMGLHFLLKSTSGNIQIVYDEIEIESESPIVEIK